MDLLPKYPHSAIICGQTGCGKTVFILYLLEERYIETFAHIVILCPTVRWNKTYHSRSSVWTDPQVFIVDPGDRLQEYLRAFYSVFAGESTLYIIEGHAVSGRHADQSVWVLTQKYNSVLKDLREQTKWIAVFHCKDRDSFDDCLRENDIVPTREERAALNQTASDVNYNP